MSKKTLVKYRTWYNGIQPKAIKPQIPGWAGRPGYSNGDDPQAWHCKPFMDAATYGLELVYPWNAECVVTADKQGNATFTGDFSEDEKVCDMKFPPFMTFAPFHYGFTSSLDIETEPGKVLRIEPHPRFYTDMTGEVPVAVAGHLETEWWSRIFFVVFKMPKPGEKHIFRKGEGYAQILVLPKEVDYDVRQMTAAEGHSRNMRDAAIVAQGSKICTHAFQDRKGNSFNNKYKMLSKICQKKGSVGVDAYLESVAENRRYPMKKCAKRRFRKIKGKK